MNEISIIERVNRQQYMKYLKMPSTDNRKHSKTGQEVLAVDPKYFRPTEEDLIIGDPTKAKTKLRWECKYDLSALVKDMMQKDQYLKDGGLYDLELF